MVKLTNARPKLDLVFAALSDPTRRSILDDLAHGSRGVTAIARSRPISLPAVWKHVRLLESAGLVDSVKRGRVRLIALRDGPIDEAAAWLHEKHLFWSQSIVRLERHITRNS